MKTGFILGGIVTGAVIASVLRRKRYPTFGKWWDAEGIGIWLSVGALILLISRI